MDEFTKKHLPREEDWFLDQDAIEKAQQAKEEAKEQQKNKGKGGKLNNGSKTAKPKLTKGSKNDYRTSSTPRKTNANTNNDTKTLSSH